MSFFKFLLLIAIASVCFSQQSAFSHRDWIEHKNAFGKVYTSASEDAARKALFERNLIAINEHNKMADEGLVSYRKGVNKFTDMTHEEVVRQYMGLELPPEFKIDHPNVTENNSGIEEEQFELTAPKSRDWRKTPGRVGPVKDQGQCGLVFKKNKKLEYRLQPIELNSKLTNFKFMLGILSNKSSRVSHSR
jgi:cathepsin L